MLTVTSAAGDLSLLTIAELRAAAGVADKSMDDTLKTLGERVASAIAAACRVAKGGTTPPTLRQETLTETFRLKSPHCELVLARRPIVSITSIVEDDETLDADDYEIEASAGMLRRLDDIGCPTTWSYRSKITVVYAAGWATVPADLKFAAAKFVQALTQEGDRDPLLKSESIDGVGSFEWWVDPTRSSVVPADVMDILDRGGYVNRWIV